MSSEQMSAKSFREMMGLPPAGPAQIVSKTPKPKNKSKEKLALEALIYRFCEGLGFTVKKEYYFHPVRKWRFDWCIMELRVGIEFNGLSLGKSEISRHQTVTGLTNDGEKLNQAQIMGFIVLQYTALNKQYEQFVQDFPLVVAARGQKTFEKK